MSLEQISTERRLNARKRGALPAAFMEKRKFTLTAPPRKWDYVRDTGECLVTHYRAGTIVHHVPVMRSGSQNAGPREVIRDMSAKSRGNAAFKFGNADSAEVANLDGVEWVAMVVLTWHHAPPHYYEWIDKRGVARKKVWIKMVLEKLSREWRKKWGCGVPAWIMEMQRRGVPHFHFFICGESRFGRQCVANVEDGRCEEFQRNGAVRTVVRGQLDRWLVETWLNVSEQHEDVEARKFHEGGIVEMMDSPDAAGRYVAKESCKREQKELPARYAAGLGRWWFLAKALKPRARKRGFASLDHWPFPRPYSRVWLTASLGAANFGSWPIERDGEAREAVAHWLRDSGQTMNAQEIDELVVLERQERLMRDSLCEEIDDMRSESEVAEDIGEAVARMHLSRLRMRGFASSFRP